MFVGFITENHSASGTAGGENPAIVSLYQCKSGGEICIAPAGAIGHRLFDQRCPHSRESYSMSTGASLGIVVVSSFQIGSDAAMLGARLLQP